MQCRVPDLQLVSVGIQHSGLAPCTNCNLRIDGQVLEPDFHASQINFSPAELLASLSSTCLSAIELPYSVQGRVLYWVPTGIPPGG